jgi:hypothetical protein
MKRPIWGSDERVMPPRKYMNYRYYRSKKVWRRYELPVLPVRDRYYRWMVVGGAVWRENELPVLSVLDRYYRWSLTGSMLGVYSKSDFQISNRFVSKSVFGHEKLRK